ncbi:hypothetical protein [Corynebacterium simulans]|uniref:hypothetical protein n=1 Tax=Corynebacterium simulans TaxID=146827 RepID=UPI0020031034|nr:hypothetical protein [Corynebacterium simulans]MCK6161549.1 hypothetical protein [Corynebacterium simulans]
MRPVLLASGAPMTVGRRTAVYTYGKFAVTLPEGREQVETDDRLENGYIYRPDDRPAGRFDFAFARADVSVDLNAGISNLENVVDTEQRRYSGDMYFQNDIEGPRLGKYIPGVHFEEGDLVDLRIWQVLVPAPVTAIDYTESGDRVHAGGQLISDPDALRQSNDDLRQQIASEKRQRQSSVDKVNKTATAADQKATTAVSTADEAKATAEATAALVEGLDLDSSIQQARDAVDASNKILELVRQFTGAAADQGSQAQASAALALEYAQQAEAVLDELDPLRDDVVAAHAEVVRLSGEAAKAAQDAAAAVARGEQYMVAAQKSAGAAAQDAAKSQELVAQAQARLDELAPLQKQAADSLAEARAMLSDVDGSGKSLSDVLLDIAAKHQQVLSAHDEILTAHGEILEIHGEAIRYAAMAAAQASAAAMQASQAASEALRAADLNAQAIGKLAEADKKLAEADRKLQEQIDLLEQAQRLLIQAIRAVAAASSQAAAAAMSAGQAAQENANAIAQTNIAVDAATDSLEALAKAQAASTQAANDAKATAVNAQKAQLDYQNTQKSIDSLQASMLLKIQRFATGIVFALREDRKRSVDHQIAFQMPGINRTMTFYADSAFDGWVYRLIIYSNGSVNAGSIPPGSWSENRNLDRSDWYAPVCASGSYKFVNFNIPVGDVAAAMVFVTKNTWQ